MIGRDYNPENALLDASSRQVPSGHLGPRIDSAEPRGSKDVTDRYAEQLKEDIDWRKQEAEKAGLGFKLPTIESSVGLLGLPKQKKSKLKKVA